jgi:hypothetical protein
LYSNRPKPKERKLVVDIHPERKTHRGVVVQAATWLLAAVVDMAADTVELAPGLGLGVGVGVTDYRGDVGQKGLCDAVDMLQVGHLAAVGVVVEVLDELVLENEGVRHCSKGWGVF